MKVLKIFISLILLLVLLLVVAIIALPQFINPNDYKAQITQTVKEKAGIELEIAGDLSLSVFPWLGIKTDNITIYQPDSILQKMPQANPLASIEALSISVKLVPLLSQKIEIDTILFKKPQIELIVLPSGEDSLSSLSASTTEEASTNKPQAGTDNSTESSTQINSQTNPQITPNNPPSNNNTAIAALSIAGIDISDGRLIYNDQLSNTRYVIEDINIQGSDLLNAETSPFAMSANISGQDLSPIALNIEAELGFNKDNFDVNANDIRLSMTQLNNNVTTTVSKIAYQHQSSQSTINNLSLAGTANDIPFKLSLPEIAIDLTKKSITIPSLSANSLDINATGDINVKNWDGMAMVFGSLNVESFNARDVLQKAQIDYTPSLASALSKISFSAGFNATQNGASLNHINAVVDNSQLTGDVSIIDFNDPKYRFDLSLNTLTIDDYLPTGQENSDNDNGGSDVNSTTALEALAAPIALLDTIFANGVFRADNITASNIKLNDNVFSVETTDKQLTITSALSLYQGTLNSTITRDKGAKSTLSLISILKDIELEPFLIDADITDQFSGTGNINSNITVTGLGSNATADISAAEIKGTIDVVAKNGAIQGIDIKQVLDDAQAKIDALRGKNTNTTAASEDETRFAEMSATLLLDNDIITNNNLSIKAPAFRIGGNGTVNLTGQTVDYLTSIVVVNTNSGQGGKNTADLKGITIPVRFTGPLSAPNYSIDFAALLKANTQESLNKEKAKLKTELKDKLAEKLGITAETNENGDTALSTDQLKEEAKNKLEDKLKEKLKNKFKSLF